jgi:hypothetical protein
METNFSVICCYVQPRIGTNVSQDPYYRAIYLREFTLDDFLHRLATKCDITPSQIIRIIRVNKQGLHSYFGDTDVCDLVDGQDMIAELQEVQLPPNSDSPITDVQMYNDVDGVKEAKSRYYELKLIY